MNATRIVAGAVLVVSLTASGCSRQTAGDPTPGPQPSGSSSTAPTPSAEVGSLHQSWSEADVARVAQYDDAHDDVILLSSHEAYQQWRAGLPAEMLDGLIDPNLTDAVAVVGSYPRCMETSAVRSPAEAQVRYDVWIPPDLATACAWSPTEVELWIVELDEIGATAPEDVELVR